MATLSTIELYKENMKFSAGHFTIFSENKREKMHGHNYTVYAAITTLVTKNGLSFDYRFYKDKLLTLCRQLNESFLLPNQSPFLTIEEKGDYYYARFHREKIPFLKSDVTLLPVTNVTVEELSKWFISQLITDKNELSKNAIRAITIKVSSSPGQSGSAQWNIQDE